MVATVAPLLVLPDGLVVPPLPYLVVLVVVAAVVGGGLARERPPVTGPVVVALAPWMAAGGALHALRQVGAAPATVGPLLDAPAVYVTTAGLTGAVWLVSDRTTPNRVAATLGTVGGLLVAVSAAVALSAGAAAGTLALFWPVVGLVVSVALSAVVYVLARQLRPAVFATVGMAAPVVVFGHVLDGVSTAVGVDVLGANERSPLPRVIMDLAAALPTEPVLGSGWLFVVVKTAIALAVVWLFADFVAEEPSQARAILAIIAAVGLGPGAHNLLLFAATAG